MTHQDMLDLIAVDPSVYGGQPCVRGTRIHIATILDGMAEGLTPEGLISHFPQLTLEDIHAALAYAAELPRENLWKVGAGKENTHA